MDDSFKFSQVIKTLMSILEDEVQTCPEEEVSLNNFVVKLDHLDEELECQTVIETLKR